MWLASCFPGCQPPFSFFLCLLFFYCVVVFLYPFLCRLSFCLSLALHVSVLFSSCVISPVSLFLVSDTRVSCIPRPGCQTCRDPDVRHVKTRVSYNALPYLRAFFQPSVVSFRAHAHILYCVPFARLSILLKKHVLQHICQSAFYKNVQEKLEKIP